MPRRYLSVVVFSIMLGLVAVFGYLHEAPPSREPVRILFENAGGNVVFSHQKHARAYNLSCTQCHHTGTYTKCGTCHGVAFDDTFRKSHIADMPDVADCVSCHHMGYSGSVKAHVVHPEHVKLKCQSCHHSAPKNQKPADCASCHKSQGGDGTLSLRAAGHGRCMGCHKTVPGMRKLSCRDCHNKNDNRARWKSGADIDFTAFKGNCADCHTKKEVQQLVPGRMNAFHDSCIPCHEKLGKGPRTKDQCKQCHTN